MSADLLVIVADEPLDVGPEALLGQDPARKAAHRRGRQPAHDGPGALGVAGFLHGGDLVDAGRRQEGGRIHAQPLDLPQEPVDQLAVVDRSVVHRGQQLLPGPVRAFRAGAGGRGGLAGALERMAHLGVGDGRRQLQPRPQAGLGGGRARRLGRGSEPAGRCFGRSRAGGRRLRGTVGHHAHQPDGLAQHFVIAAHALLERCVDGLGFLRRRAGGGQQVPHPGGQGRLQGLRLGGGVGGQHAQALFERGDRALQAGQGRAGHLGGALDALGGLARGLLDQLGGLGDQPRGVVQPRLDGGVGLLAGGEGRLAQLLQLPAGGLVLALRHAGGGCGGLEHRLDAAHGVRFQRLTGGARRLGGLGHPLGGLFLHGLTLAHDAVGQILQRPLDVGQDALALEAGGFGQRAQGLQRAGGQQVALGLGHLGRFLGLAHGRIGEVGQRTGRRAGRFVQIGDAVGGMGQDLGQLDALGLDHHREVLVVRPDLVGGQHQRRALVGEGVLHRADLVADAERGGLQAGGLAGQVVAGGLGGLGRFPGGGGEVGRAGGQRRFGLADLGLGEVGRLRDHAGLAGDRLADLARAVAERPGQVPHALALAGKALADGPGGVDGALGQGGQPAGLFGEGLVQGHEVGPGLGGDFGQGDDLLAHTGGGGVGLGGAQDGGLEDLLGQGVGARRAHGDVQALAHGEGRDPEEGDRDQGEDRQQRQAVGLQLHRAQRELVADGVDRDHRPEHGGGAGQAVDQSRRAFLGRGQARGRRQRLGRQRGLGFVDDRRRWRGVGLDQFHQGKFEILVERGLGTRDGLDAVRRR